MTGWRARRMARLLPLTFAALSASFAAAACTDVPTGADVPFSLEFERLPFPAVVVGDQLRDTTGTAVPLGAVAYNADGEPIDGAAIDYLLLGDAATLEEGTFVRGVTANDTVRITAQAGAVPSLPRLLWVVPRPDSLAVVAAPPDTVTWGIPPNPTLDTSEPISVTLLSRATGTAVPVRSWVVRYRLVVNGDTLAPSDTTTVAWLVDDAGRRSAIDTTDANGLAARRVRVNGLDPAIDALESIVVSVTTLGTVAPPSGAPVLDTLVVRRRQ